MKSSAFSGAIIEEDPFGLLIRFLKKRGWIPVVTVALGFVGAIVANHVLPKLYVAQTSLEIQGGDSASQFRLEQVQDLSGAGDTSERLDTEIEILRSHDLAL